MGKRKHRYTAKNADRHLLYQKSVQSPEHEVQLLSRHFKRHAGRRAVSLREDFCGTALLCGQWVESKSDRLATGLDIDAPTLAWGREHNLASLGDAARRVTLLEQNVLEPTDTRFDVICAFNYSYSVFKTRAQLRAYFEAAHRSLVDEGLFVLDGFGGWETQQELVEKRVVDGFTYVWDQAAFDPISHHFLAHIHFHFPDGTKLKEAFTYDWRLWMIPELKELLLEAGFAEVEVLWEGEDENGQGSGTFSRVTTATNDPGWNTYLVARKNPPEPGSKDGDKRARQAARALAKAAPKAKTAPKTSTSPNTAKTTTAKTTTAKTKAAKTTTAKTKAAKPTTTKPSTTTTKAPTRRTPTATLETST